MADVSRSKARLTPTGAGQAPVVTRAADVREAVLRYEAWILKTKGLDLLAHLTETRTMGPCSVGFAVLALGAHRAAAGMETMGPPARRGREWDLEAHEEAADLGNYGLRFPQGAWGDPSWDAVKGAGLWALMEEALGRVAVISHLAEVISRAADREAAEEAGGA